MKVHIQRSSFVPAFQQIAGFASTKDLKPVLQSVKLVAERPRVILMAADGETAARAEIEYENPFNIAEDGSVLLPAKLLDKIFKETTDDEILLETSGDRLTVKGARFTYNLDVIAATDQFPDVVPFEETYSFKIASADVRRMIKRTLFATDLLNAHYLLSGVQFILDRDSALSVATDGRRLAVQNVSSEIIGELPDDFKERKAYFSVRSLKLVAGVSASSPESQIVVKNEQAQFMFGNVIVQATLLSGRFPNWELIVPENGKLESSVDFISGDVARAVRLSEIVTTENKPGIVLTFDDGKLTVAAEGETTGESSVELPVSYDGANVALRFDPKFLSEFFKELAPEEVVKFHFSENEFRTLIETNDGYRYVVMQLS